MSAHVVVLCGGTSRRFRSGDKTAAALAGTTVLDRLLTDLPPDWPVTCVGEARPTQRDVRWCRENPPLGGPVAGIAAGLEGVTLPVVVVLAGDQPFAGGLVSSLVAALAVAESRLDGVVALTDGPQYLLGAYRAPALRRVTLGRADVSVRSTLGTLATQHLSVPSRAAMDIDTVADLDRAQAMEDPPA